MASGRGQGGDGEYDLGGAHVGEEPLTKKSAAGVRMMRQSREGLRNDGTQNHIRAQAKTNDLSNLSLQAAAWG